MLAVIGGAHDALITLVVVICLFIAIAWAAVHYLPPPVGYIVAFIALVIALLILA